MNFGSLGGSTGAATPSTAATMTIMYQASDSGNLGETIQYADAAGGVPILVNGPPQVVSQADADRLAADGVEFAYLVDHEMPDGQRWIMTIPVN